MENIIIKELALEEFEDFMNYLTIHLSENGKDNHFFQPVSKDQLNLDAEWQEKFKAGLTKTWGETIWRKLWLAKNRENQILGHVDIRSRNEPNTLHRVLLGMGVHSDFRKMKIGQQLLTYAIKYCINHPEIVWLDLEVMTNNIPAVNLYLKNDFNIVANYADMFRIEGKSFDYTAMTLKVG